MSTIRAAPSGLLVTCIVACLYHSSKGQGLSEYNRLTTALFNGYEKRVRPSVAGDATSVYMTFEPSSILSLDETEQVLYTYAAFKCRWSDEHLSWNKSAYSNIESFLWPQDDVWLPDLVISNSVKTQDRMGYDEMPVRVSNTGSVTWYPSKIFATSCDMDVTYYPFDTQTCTLILATKMSTYREIEILADGDSPISWTEYSAGSSWDLQSITVEELAKQGNITRIQFKLQLRRLRTFYIMNIILPVLFLSFTASVVFYLPADAGEKMGMSMTVLLAYAVYLTIISDNMPQTSLQVSLLAVYLTILLGFTALGVTLSVIVLALHHKSDARPVGSRTAAATRNIRRFLCLGSPLTKKSHNRISPLHPPAPPATLKHTGLALNGCGFESRNTSSEKTILTDSRPCSAILRHREKPDGDAVSFAPSTLSSEAERETITWTKVAETVDRTLFIAFSFLVFIITVSILPYIAIMGN